MDNILSVLVFFPAIAGLLGFVVNKDSARAYGITVAAIEPFSLYGYGSVLILQMQVCNL